MIKLTDVRLKAIVNEILPCDILVDIGSDHGYVAAYACQKHLCKRAIATDISSGSLMKVSSLIQKERLTNIETRLGNGVEVLNIDEYDTVVIAGMGGIEIINILEKSLKIFKRYILSPQKNQYELRKYLSKHNVNPIKDYKVLSKSKYYDIIVAEEGIYTPQSEQLYYGNMDGEFFESFRACEIKKLTEYYKRSKDDAKRKLAEKLFLLGVNINEINGNNK